MKKIFTLVLFMICVYGVAAQPYLTGKRSITFTDNNRSGRLVPTDIYYPANVSGNNVALALGVAKFPVVVFGHGFLIAASSYKWMADSLIKTGYIVAFPTTEDGLIPNHLDFALDLEFLCKQLLSLNDSANSFLYQRVIKKAAVGGHSMGGGASFLAAATSSSSINVLFNFASAETVPPATLAAYLNFKPTLIFSGSADCIAPDSIQEVMYNNSLLACRTYINITNGLHCQFANNNFICAAGQFASGCGTTSLSTAALLTKTMSLLLPFLDYYLKDICKSGETFIFNYNTITGVTKRRSCFPLASCGPVPIKLISFTGNVNAGKIALYWNTAAEENVSIIIVEKSNNGASFSNFAEVSPKGINGAGASYSVTDSYPFAGVNFYRLKIVDLDGSISYSSVLKLATPKKILAVTSMYPNPVKDILHVQLQSEKQQVVNVFIYDLAGRQLQVSKIYLQSGINETAVSFTNITVGTYILEYKNETGDRAYSVKIVKSQ